jgi:hypothetical protein
MKKIFSMQKLKKYKLTLTKYPLKGGGKHTYPNLSEVLKTSGMAGGNEAYEEGGVTFDLFKA